MILVWSKDINAPCHFYQITSVEPVVERSTWRWTNGSAATWSRMPCTLFEDMFTLLTSGAELKRIQAKNTRLWKFLVNKLSNYSSLPDRNPRVTQYPTFQICCLNPNLCLTTSIVYASLQSHSRKEAIPFQDSQTTAVTSVWNCSL